MVMNPTKRTLGLILGTAMAAVAAGYALAGARGPVADGVQTAGLAALQPATDAMRAAATADLPRSPQDPIQEARRLGDAFAQVARRVTPAVVRIQTERTIPNPHADASSDRFREFFGVPEGEDMPDVFPEVTGGSGFLVTSGGLILTNNHVVEEAERITVTLSDKRMFEAELVGGDPTTDVAVVRIQSDGLPTVELGDSETARVGQWVLAVGNPGFSSISTLDFTVTSGILSAKGRPLGIIGRELRNERNPASRYVIEDFLQTDAVINPGNSGGPLVDLDGRVIGINTAIASETGFYQGYGFAIPISVAQRVMADLLEHGRVRRALLGVTINDVTTEDAEVYRLPDVSGVLVQDFGEDSPARRAGVRRHDVIVAVNGQKVERLAQLQRYIARHRPGETVRLTAIRYGTQVRFDVTLTEAPDFGGTPPAATPTPRRSEGLGLEFADLTPRLARQFGHSEAGGVVVSRVEPTSPAFRRDVRPRMKVLEINRQVVDSARAARAIVEAARPGEVVSLLLADVNGSTLIANVRVP